MIENEELYEYDLHHNHYYGTSKKQLNDRIEQGKTVISDIEVNGVENLVRILKDKIKVVTIFLKVPKEELRKRLEARIDKPDEKEIELRLGRLEYEESKIGNYDYVIENLDLESTVQKVMEIIKSN